MANREKHFILHTMLILLVISMAGGGTNVFASEKKSNEQKTSVEVWDGSVDTKWEGKGTKESPYLISSAAELAGIASKVSDSSLNYFSKKYFKQTCNIYLNDNSNFDTWVENQDNLNVWSPISCFYGNYDGGNYVIAGMYCNSSQDSGLFKKCGGGVIENLTVMNGLIINKGNSSWTGGIIGSIFSSSSQPTFTIRNCNFQGIINVSGKARVGGIAGFVSSGANSNSVTFENCNHYGEIMGGGVAGGIVGYASQDFHDTFIKNCINYGTIKSSAADESKVGGIVGEQDGDDGGTITVQNCVNTAYLTNAEYAGGIMGYAYPSFDSVCQITECYNAGNVNATQNNGYAGGIIGVSYASVGGNTNILSCFNVGVVISPYYAGGIAGAYSHKGSYGSSTKTIKKSYNAGAVSGKYTGGILPSYVASSFENNFYLTGDYTSRNTGKELSCDEMKKFENYTGFSSSIWTINEVANDGFPYLKFSTEGLTMSCTETNKDAVQVLIDEVKKYTTGGENDKITEILTSSMPYDLKQQMVCEELAFYGITDINEGITYLKDSMPQRLAYDALITNEIFCACNYEYWLNNTTEGKGTRLLLGADGLVFNNEISAWINPTTYLSGDLPGVKKYKEMLTDFMEINSNRLAIYKYAKESHTVLDNLLKVYSTAESTVVQGMFDKLARAASEEEAEAIAGQIAKLMNIQDNSVIRLKSETLSDALDHAGTVIEIADFAVEDLMNLINLSAKLEVLKEYSDFLKDIAFKSGSEVPWELRVAALQLCNELQSGYLGSIKDLLIDCFDEELKIMKFPKMVLGSKLSDALATLKLSAWLVNTFGVDMGQVVKRATYIEGYAYLGHYYRKKLIDSRQLFMDNPSSENAWGFYENYDMLWSLRKAGENMFLDMYDFDGVVASQLKKNQYQMRKEVIDSTINNLDNKWKFNEDVASKASDKLFCKKIIIECPVDVGLYDEQGNLLEILVDRKEVDYSNAHGRFVEIYRPFTDDYTKIIYLSDDSKYSVKIIANNPGLVSGSISVSADTAAKKFCFNNEALNKENTIVFNVPEYGDEKLQYTVFTNADEKETISINTVSPSDNDYVPVSGIKLQEKEIRLEIGETKLLKADVQPENATYKMLRFISDNTDAVVIKNGLLQAVNSGSANICILSADNQYTGQCKVTVTKNINECLVSIEADNYTYDGMEKRPAVQITDMQELMEGIDYTLTYDNNCDAGKGSVTIRGIGAYTGMIVKDFQISQAGQTLTANISSSEIPVGKSVQINTDGIGDIDYQSNNTDIASVDSAGFVTGISPGTAEILVTAAGDKNTLPCSIALSVIVTEDNQEEYTKEMLEAAKKRALEELEKYKKAEDYRENQKKELSEVLKVGKEAIERATDEMGIHEALATAKALIDEIKTDTQLKEKEKDIAVTKLKDAKKRAFKELEEYRDPKEYREDQKKELSKAVKMGKEAIEKAADEAGVRKALATAKEVINGIKTDTQLREEEKTQKTTDKIEHFVKISDVAQVTIRKKSCTYSGKRKKPGVIVKAGTKILVKNADYTVSYKNNIKIGKAFVIITGKGGYQGRIVKTFKIIPKGTSIVGKVVAKSKGFLVKWKKQKKNITGYQLQYSTSRKFKKKATVIKTVKKKVVTHMSVGKLKPGKKYYVRVRTYKTVKGKKYYSSWSKIKKVTVKIGQRS